MKTAFVKATEMDFSEGKVFDAIDEQERVEAERLEAETPEEKKLGPWEMRKRKVKKTAKDLIFG